MSETIEDLRRRWMAKVDQRGENECWEWTGGRTTANYGLIYVDGKQRGAHRVSWTIYNGPIPPGLNVCHHCDNPPCVNPAHLFVGTQKDNLHDARAKGRTFSPFRGQVQRGSLNRHARLNEDAVREIRRLRGAGWLHREIAAKFDVHRVTITLLLKGDTWSHVE